MPIEQTGPLTAAAASRAPRRAARAGGRFVLPDMADEPEALQDAAPSEPTMRAATVGMIALQSAGPSQEEADRMAAGQGRALLGALAGLQVAGLEGSVVQARATLADLARALPRAADPKLDAVLRAIAQRAAIELARAG